MQRAPADFKARRFQPAARLSRSGEPGRETLLSLLAGIEEWMGSAETRHARAHAHIAHAHAHARAHAHAHAHAHAKHMRMHV
jgi:hypothetical protein